MNRAVSCGTNSNSVMYTENWVPNGREGGRGGRGGNS